MREEQARRIQTDSRKTKRNDGRKLTSQTDPGGITKKMKPFISASHLCQELLIEVGDLSGLSHMFCLT